MSDKKFDITIVGGGVIGLCCAYYLNLNGLSVRILDREKVDDYSGTSYGNAGMIVPSHFIPLAAPGVVSQGLKWMLNSKSPLYIKPRASWNLITWLLRFVQAANKTHVEQSSPIIRDLNLLSKKLYGDLSSSEGLDFGLKHRGIVMMSTSEKDLEEEIEVGEQAKKLGLDVDILDQVGIKELEPDVTCTVRGGVHYPLDAHLVPAQFVKSMSGLLESRGVKIEKGSEVIDFELEGTKVTGIITNKGKIETEEVIIASGTWSGMVSHKLGLNIPMQAGKGYSFTVAHDHLKLRTPSILTEARVAVTPMGDRLRFGGTMEIAGIDASINMKRVKAILNSLSSYYPDFKKEWVNLEETWRGLRPLSPDGLPYIGRSAKHSNVLMATGHAMMGLSLAPVTGKLISEIMNNETPSIELKLLDPNRFD